jgi:hypothetical protein
MESVDRGCIACAATDVGRWAQNRSPQTDTQVACLTNRARTLAAHIGCTDHSQEPLKRTKSWERSKRDKRCKGSWYGKLLVAASCLHAVSSARLVGIIMEPICAGRKFPADVDCCSASQDICFDGYRTFIIVCTKFYHRILSWHTSVRFTSTRVFKSRFNIPLPSVVTELFSPLKLPYQSSA